METKTDLVKKLVRQQNYKAALQICKDWIYEDSNDRDQLRLGYECLLYPDFYRQIGKNPGLEYKKSVKVLIRLYKH